MTISITLLVARLLCGVSHIWHNAGYNKYVKHAIDTYVVRTSLIMMRNVYCAQIYIRSPSVA